MNQKPKTVQECKDAVLRRHQDDLLDVLQPIMRANALKRREQEQLRQKDIVRFQLGLLTKML